MDHPPGDSLEELAASLEADGDERASAVEGLASVEPEIRSRIIEGLGKLPRGPGLSAFLRELNESSDPATALAARNALNLGLDSPGRLPVPLGVVDRAPARPRLTGSLVSAVDGRGRATIAVSAERDGTHRSAVFRCNVLTGFDDVFGRVDAGPPEAGGLIDEAAGSIPDGCDRLQDVPELALSLLAGALHLAGRQPARVSAQSWVDEVLGPGFRPRPMPIPTVAPQREPTDLDDMPRHARAVLDGCPSWVDASALTLEMAEEIELREGEDRPTDPTRHAGAYRYLFEHHLVRRLDLYGRMLLWMASFWRSAGEAGLSESAFALAAELADEQFAVPSHPFTAALTTRSLDEARRLVRSRPGK
jgi:hypothetical protein